MKKKFLSAVLSAVCAISLTACTNTDQNTPSASSESNSESVAEETPAEAEGVFVLMNIPYGDFFAAEFEGGEKVDAVTSATMSKAANEKLAGGTYHPEDNSKILGITYPVYVREAERLDGTLKMNEEAQLFAAADYAYTELSDTPDYYKELSVDASGKFVFGKSEGAEETISGDDAKIETETRWGDYQIELDQSLSELTVCAAGIHTTDGKSYGFRALENVWRGFEIAFAVTEEYQEPHGNTVAYEPYADLPGKTIDEITLYTTSGVRKMNVNLYLPLKFKNTITVADAAAASGSTAVSFEGFPEDYRFAYEVTGAGEELVCSGDAITWKKALAGVYTLSVSDQSGVYAPYHTSFILSTDKKAAAAKEDGIEKAKNASDEEFEAYIKNITGYVVNGEEIAGSGKRGAKIIKEDGTADKTLNKVFSEVGEYDVVIESAGSPDTEIKVTITEVAPEEEKKEGGK
ncbi:MAG: hypothetical protein ILP09_05865 [Oscillospiraceae bacterium]|nr:hypothetical protein [Oscillospiraceae bacterium]